MSKKSEKKAEKKAEKKMSKALSATMEKQAEAMRYVAKYEAERARDARAAEEERAKAEEAAKNKPEPLSPDDLRSQYLTQRQSNPILAAQLWRSPSRSKALLEALLRGKKGE